MVILAGHCPSTGRYFEPWKRNIQFRKFVDEFIFPVIYLKAMHLTGHNDRSTRSFSGQMVILAGHCPSTGRYFEPWKRNIQFRKFLSQERTQIIGLSRVHNKQA